MVFAAILAGGIGLRMNISNMPKQFLPLGSKPVIIHTLEKFLISGFFDEIYVGVHCSWIQYCQDLIYRNFMPAWTSKIHIINGGQDRNETIQKIIRAIECDWGESDEHIIVTHDSVRPFVSLRILQENVNAAQRYGACDTVVPATDTIVVSEDGLQIQDIPQRKNMYQGQTPQSFQLSLFKKLYQTLSEEESTTLTDACKVCVLRDIPVHLVMGDVLNMKLTTIEDYRIAQALIGMEVSL